MRFTSPDDLDVKRVLLWCLEASRMQQTTRNELILIMRGVPFLDLGSWGNRFLDLGFLEFLLRLGISPVPFQLGSFLST